MKNLDFHIKICACYCEKLENFTFLSACWCENDCLVIHHSRNYKKHSKFKDTCHKYLAGLYIIGYQARLIHINKWYKEFCIVCIWRGHNVSNNGEVVKLLKRILIYIDEHHYFHQFFTHECNALMQSNY